MRCKTDQTGFTLAELLVVISIIAIMLAIALPAMVDMTGNAKLDAAANTLQSAANLARQHAITHSQPTYLVLQDADSTDDSAQAYRSYAVFTINTHIHPVSQSSGQFLINWEALPKGIVFDDSAGGSDNVFMVSDGAAWNGAISKNNVLKIGSRTYIVQGFKPTGEAGSNTHWIFLTEGFYDTDGQLIRTAKQGKQIRFDITGKSMVVDHVYEDDGTSRAPAD